MNRLVINVLGGLEIQLVGADSPLALSTRKSKALLAYLALSPGLTRSREHLATALWDRSAEEQARASLRQTLSSLRRVLPSSSSAIVNTDAYAVWLDAQSIQVDAHQFERLAAERSPESLEQAVAVYRGDLLDGFSLREESFENWAVSERRRLRELALQAFSDLLSHYARNERLEPGIQIAERLLSMDPLQEWAHCALMRLYSRSGRREAALRQYQECTRILDRELGIAPAEQSQRLAAEIGRETDSPVSLVTTPSAEARRSEPSPALPAERKQLTVLCARIREVVDGSDPEATLERVDPVLEAMADAIGRFGGTISHIRGDGVTALFGAPQAHEDHAVRACYAALAMRDTFPSNPALDIRIAIHSGEAVVRTIGDEHSRHYDAVGPVAQITDLIGAVIDPGEIGITAEVNRRTEGFVEIAALGERSLESVAAPIELFVLRARSPLRSRWEVRSARALTRFIGRDAEMARLGELLELAASGSGQVAAVMGEPGMGKSRLVHEFLDSPAIAGWTVLETGTTSHDTSATYLPIANLLRAWFDIGERDTQSKAAEKLRAGVRAIDEALDAMLPPLFALLDLPVDDLHWSTLSPPQRRQSTLEAVNAVLIRHSHARPIIVVVEDLHWTDVGTQAVLENLVENVGASRVVLLFTHRPEYRHEWFVKTYFSQLRLNPLGAENSNRLLSVLLGENPELERLRRRLIERTEGTPLFVEESVRALVETGALVGKQGAFRLGQPIESFEIPSTVQVVLAARIDRLPANAKELLQTAAVIGKDVPVKLLEAIADVEEGALGELLDTLQSAEFLYQTRLLSDPEFTFKHALTHQVAYETVLKERRRAAHVRLVGLIEELYANRLEEQVERLAHHALGGELRDKAIHYLFRSASKAIQRSAHQQAIEYLERGLELIASLPDSQVRLRQELDYQKALGVTMMAAKGWAAKEVLDAYTRARVLCEELGDERELFIALRGQGQYHMIRGESRVARDLGDRCFDLAAGSEDVGVHIETHHLFWTNSFFMGDYANAELHCGKGVDLYESDRDHALTFVYSGHDPGVCCRSFSALIQCLCGRPDQALDGCRQALDLAEQLNHPLTTALAQWAFSYAHLFRREPHAARDWAEREIAVCEEYLLPLLHSQGMFQLGWALSELGELDEGIARMREGLAATSATGAEMGLPYFVALLGEALGKAGKPDEGLREVERALSTAKEHNARFQFSEILRLKGELLLMLSKSNGDTVKACFCESLETADKQGARLAKLRSAVSLARFFHAKGDPVNARAVLQPSFAVIIEGHHTPALEEAATLLEVLERDIG